MLHQDMMKTDKRKLDGFTEFVGKIIVKEMGGFFDEM